jgi:ribosomal protein L21
MYAVIRSGGKQYRVEAGKTVRVERAGSATRNCASAVTLAGAKR